MYPPQPFGQFTPIEIGFEVLHSGYREQARNRPNRPRFTTIGEPQFGHFSSVVISSSLMGAIVPSSSRRKFIVFRHSGYREQARNSPMRPQLMTMGLPHWSHVR